MQLLECFNVLLPATLAERSADAAALNAVLRVVATGDGGGDWTVVLKNPTPSCRPYAAEDEGSIDAVMTMAASNFETWLTSPTMGVQMVLDKRLVVTGPSGPKAVALRKAIALIPA